MANLGFNPLLDPATQAQIDRQRQYAQLLQQQSMTPAEGQMVSGHYVAPSWTQGLARLMQGYTAGKINKDTDAQQSGLWKNQMAALAQMLSPNSQAAPSQASPSDVMGAGAAASPNDASGNNTGGVGPTTGNAQTLDSMPPTQPRGFVNQGSNNFNMANILKSNAISSLGGDAAGAAFWKQYEPTDASKMALAAGLDPKLANQQALEKSTYIAPASIRPGGFSIDPHTGQPTAYPAAAPPGFGYIKDQNSPMGWSLKAIPGGIDAIAQESAAKASGPAQFNLQQVYNPETQQMEYVPATQVATASGGGIPPGAQPPNNGLPTNNFNTPYPVTFGAPGTTNTDQREGTTTEASVAVRNPATPNHRGLPATAPLGTPQGATNAQNELSKKFSDLQAQNAQAQTTNSYLQNIKEQAKAAAVGPMATKIDFVNGLLSLVGNQKATDAVTANDLLNKYSNQIVTRLGGSGGLASDAARSLLASAYPNEHMNIKAINEAADNLIGANEMIKAKTSLVAPHGNARDPVGYQQKEQMFDQNADPRLWQYKAIAGTPQGKVFLQSVLKQDPKFLDKMKNLHDLGAF